MTPSPHFRCSSATLSNARWLLTGVLLFLTMTTANGQSRKGIDDPGAKTVKFATAGDLAVEVRFTDNSMLKLVIKEERIEFMTQYGKLSIPANEIRRIEFGLRVPEETQKRIEAALTDLGNSQYRRRETASAILLGLREKAFPAVFKATKNPDMEIANRAEELVKKFRETVPAELLQAREYDVIHTDSSRIAGHIEASALRANTIQFGEVQLRLADVYVLTAKGVEPEMDEANVAVAPSSMTQYQNDVGKIFIFKVTGSSSGSLWGTDIYTADSTVATAAVHAGLLQPGQSGVIKVTMMASPNVFVGTTRNGVTSSAYQQYPAAYRVHK
jgi:hypothetical protein